MKKTLLYYILEGFVLIIIFSFIINHYQKENDIIKHNINTYKNEITELELKNGELLTIRDSYIASINELEEMLGISRNEIKELKKSIGEQVAYISKLEANIKVDTVTTHDTVIKHSEKIDIMFSYSDKWLEMNGLTTLKEHNSETKIYNINMNVPLIVGLSDDYKIFIKSENPYINFSNIEGAVIDKSKLAPRKKRLSWGIQGGFGIMYDIIDKDLSLGPYGGLGIIINL